MQPHPSASLHDLEGTQQPEAGVTSVLARTIRYHRHTPIAQLGTEALRLLLEEGESVGVLLRIALNRLERDPFLGGDFHPGDLLVAVLHLPNAEWLAAPDLRARAFALAQDAGDLCDMLEPADAAIVRDAIADFQVRWSHSSAGP